MTDYIVEVKYTFRIKKESEKEATKYIDDSMPNLWNPQTGERIKPEIEAYEER